MSKVCYGCGSILQYDDETKEGYIPENKYEESTYCKRCFRLIHYGENKQSNKPKESSDIINNVNKNAKYVIFLTDFVSVTSEVMKLYKSIKVPKTLVISKSDIIPKNVSFSLIKDYFKVIYKVKENIIFTNNKSNLNTLIKELYGKDEVYFLGVSNSGKSTLINTLMDKYDVKKNRLTTSYKENTTLDFLRINLGELTIIDSPGFVVDAVEINKNTLIDEEIKPITYQQKCPTTYKFNNGIKIKVDGTTNLTFYFGKNVKIDRLYNKEIIGSSLVVSNNSDIVITGLGFIKVTNKTKIIISKELLRYVDIRPSITGGKSIN